MNYFSTHKLDKIVSDRRSKLEEERKQLLTKTLEWLDQYASGYGIKKAYIFGSVIRPGKFHQNSDIDLAVEEINEDEYCSIISLLSMFLDRSVDIIKLENCHFAHRIRDDGILWTKTA